MTIVGIGKTLGIAFLVACTTVGNAHGLETGDHSDHALFDHALHEKFECAGCHNFAVDPKTRKAIPNEKIRDTIFRKPLKEICHECHRSAEVRYEAAPKTCYTCHRNVESLNTIKPENHRNIGWRGSHSTEARIAGDTCMNCHMTAQCVKCHTQRNDISLRNHTRNFRMYHSVQARLQPHRCEACHTQSYCANCHLGGRP